MISLRSKLWIGFGGLLLILVVVSSTSISVLTRYSHALERVFRENYDSAVYCDAMKESLDRLNNRAQRLLWDQPDETRHIDAQTDITQFETNLAKQSANITLDGELERTRRIGELWSQYKSSYLAFDATPTDRQSAYRTQLLPQYQQLKEVAQQVADMNMSNMVSVDGQVKRTLTEVRTALVVLVGAGSLLAILFVGGIGASILGSISTLTRSARRIESGDLDLVVDIRSRDEIGQLGMAFNSMASKLRHFRQLDSERLIRTQRTTQLAIDSLPDAVFVIDASGKVEISNRTADRHFKIVPGATVDGLNLNWLTEIYDVVIHERKPFEASGYKSAIQLFESGHERFLLPHAVPIVGDDGSLLGVTVVLVDVTQLRQADELKSGLVSTVSHELRTPLTSIRMGVLLLDGEKLGSLNDRQKRSLAAVRDETDRLHRTIENLLSMGRIESGRAKFEFRPMTPREIVQQSVDPLRNSFDEKRVALTVHVADDAPAVLVDPACVALPLTNLVSNALKFTSPGGKVSVDVTRDGNNAVFIVADNGPGVPPQYSAKIFEKFFRVPRADGPTGAGLGLAIAKEIVEVHGGQIHFENSGGARFTFTIPAIVDAPADASIGAAR